MLRWLGAAAVGLLTLTGCTVPVGGKTGMTVDATGEPMVLIQMCEGHVDSAVLYEPDGEPNETLGEWETDSQVTGFSEFSLAKGGNGWHLTGTPARLNQHVTYSVYGGTRDNSWSTGYVNFTSRDLAGLKPGSVLVLDNETDAAKKVSLDDFKSCVGW